MKVRPANGESPVKERIRINEICLCPIEKLHLLLKEIRRPLVVGIEKSNILAARGAEAGVAGGRGSSVFLFDVLEARWITLQDVFELFGVWRTIVDYDHFITVNVCAKTESRVSPIYAAALNAGMITLIRRAAFQILKPPLCLMSSMTRQRYLNQ